MITVQECDFCRGRPVEVLAERIGEEWRPIRCIPHGYDRWTWPNARDVLAKEFPTIFRWQDGTCPRCSGRGSYEVEHVPFKIF